MKTIIRPLIHSTSRTLCRFAFLILLPLACCVLAQQARAVCQQGCDLANDNTFLGDDALISNTTGFDNTAIGAGALLSNITGQVNTASGFWALYSNTTGENNTANGAVALQSNTIGYGNTASGAGALEYNSSGNFNTASGGGALQSNSTGNYNTASGAYALNFNTTGGYNTANGAYALLYATTGGYNTATGYGALLDNTIGGFNTASGASALYSNTTGNYNTASGLAALGYNTTGSSNTAYGLFALEHNTTGSSNIAVGISAGTNLTTGSGNIDIGNAGVAAESNTIRIGTSQSSAFVAGVRNAVVSGGVAVYAAANGQLGTNPSSERFKHEISDMGERSEAILALRPVAFRYKEELDPKQMLQFGLVAEQAEKVDPDLVARDEEGKPYSVRYDQVNAMLLNEFLKEHKTVQNQQKKIDNLEAELKEQKALIQKVSAQLELTKSAPETVLNNH